MSESAEKKEEKFDKPLEMPAIEEPIKKEDLILPQLFESGESKEKKELEKPQ